MRKKFWIGLSTALLSAACAVSFVACGKDAASTVSSESDGENITLTDKNVVDSEQSKPSSGNPSTGNNGGSPSLTDKNVSGSEQSKPSSGNPSIGDNGGSSSLDESETGLKYALSADGTYYSVKGNVSGDISIPAAYEGKPVKEIANNAFSGCVGLTDITIPDSVTRIGSQAFNGCVKLTTVTLGSAVQEIGLGAFLNCYRLVEVYNRSALTVTAGSYDNGCVAYYAAHACTVETDKKQITTDGDGYTVYGGNILMAYTGSQTEITIPNGITRIRPRAFENCSSLTGVTIPASVTAIGDYAFYGCSALASVTIGNSVEFIGEGAFRDCGPLKNVVIPASVTRIEIEAFRGCDHLESLTLPFVGGANGIANSHLGYIFGESNFKFNSDSVPATLKTVVVTGGDLLGNGAFYGCRTLTSVTLPDSVTSIGNSAFENCGALTSIKIPDSVTSIGDYAFKGCGKLASATIGSSVKNIWSNAFENCGALTSITIPSSVERLGKNVFKNCNKLTSVKFENAKGWKVSKNYDMSNAENVSSSDLSDQGKAKDLLKSNYLEYYWKRG